jgi:hypothetical protein
MPNITIGRYDSPAAGFGGWIEGAAANGATWITFLDTAGRPVVHWPDRAPDGSVTGEPVQLV